MTRASCRTSAPRALSASSMRVPPPAARAQRRAPTERTACSRVAKPWSAPGFPCAPSPSRARSNRRARAVPEPSAVSPKKTPCVRASPSGPPPKRCPAMVPRAPRVSRASVQARFVVAHASAYQARATPHARRVTGAASTPRSSERRTSDTALPDCGHPTVYSAPMASSLRATHRCGVLRMSMRP